MMDDNCIQSIPSRVESVLERIKQAAARAGKHADDIRVVAVSKRKPVEAILAAFDSGIIEFGENYVQEAEEKASRMPEGSLLHMVGGLQRNKAKKAAILFDMIQSVDNVRVAEALDRELSSCGRRIEVLVELNIGREQGKSGVSYESLWNLLAAFERLHSVTCAGMMVIPPEGETVRWFPEARRIFEEAGRTGMKNIEMKYLSMGMSADFEEAISEGSNMVRIGSAIFGKR